MHEELHFFLTGHKWPVISRIAICFLVLQIKRHLLRKYCPPVHCVTARLTQYTEKPWTARTERIDFIFDFFFQSPAPCRMEKAEIIILQNHNK